MQDIVMGVVLLVAGVLLLLIARPRNGVPTRLTQGILGSATPMAFVCLVTFGLVFIAKGIIG